MAVYSLPELPYDYTALEPHISATITELHHDKHHATYVAGANTALEKLTIWWNNLSPDGGDKPTGELESAVDEYFGSFDKFQAHFTAAALGVQGSGWAALTWDTLGQRINIQQFFDQQGNFPAGTVPLLLLDVWEHAYYLDYKNVRADYVKAFWNIVNWADVQARFEVARKQTNGLLVLS
jgi:Fe-Mn family superoxide dismutase